MVTKLRGASLQSKVITASDVRSFVDIRLQTSKIINLEEDSSTGYDANTVYSSVISIGGSQRTISVTGSSVTTIAQLVTALNSSLSGSATATFVKDESLIKIIASASGSTAISVVTIGTLISGLVGDKAKGISASYGTPCVGGGVNFILSNVASATNTISAAYLVQSRTSAGANVEVTSAYVTTTGVLQIKKASGAFSVGDVVTTFYNLS